MAPDRAPDATRYFNWYYFWDYSGGLPIGQAAHIVDAIHWFMNSKAPLAVTCAGGRAHLSGAEVPATATVAIEYPEDYLATFTLGYKAMRYNGFNDQYMNFHGSHGRLDAGRESFSLYPESQAIEMKPPVDVKKPGSFSQAAPAHVRNFLERERSRKTPNAPAEAAQSCNIVLRMAMDSLRQGRRLKWNGEARRVE